jgi:hypothetical protein
MTFKEAIEKTPNLESAFRVGLQALRSEDKPHIEAEDTRRLCGSADVDSALLKSQPNANRWDFAIGYDHKNRVQHVIYWVELHTGSDAEVKVVIAKAKWLLNWLKTDGAELNRFERDIVWVSSGATRFTLTAPQEKQMAEAGLTHKGLMLRIRDNRA